MALETAAPASPAGDLIGDEPWNVHQFGDDSICSCSVQHPPAYFLCSHCPIPRQSPSLRPPQAVDVLLAADGRSPTLTAALPLLRSIVPQSFS